MDDMTGALLPPPQLLLMLVMVLTQALAGSAVGRLSACWNGIISSCRKIMLLLVRTQSVHTYSYSRTDTVKKKKKKKKLAKQHTSRPCGEVGERRACCWPPPPKGS